MNNRFACLVAAGFALAVGPCAVIAASSHSAADVEILVDGAPQPRYAQNGRWYVEARKGREYAIRLRNPYPVRVAVARRLTGSTPSMPARQRRPTRASGCWGRMRP